MILFALSITWILAPILWDFRNQNNRRHKINTLKAMWDPTRFSSYSLILGFISLVVWLYLQIA